MSKITGVDDLQHYHPNDNPGMHPEMHGENGPPTGGGIGESEGPMERSFGEYEQQTAHERAVQPSPLRHGGTAVVNDAYTTGSEDGKFRAIGNVTYEGGPGGISRGPQVDVEMTREGGAPHYTTQEERDKAISAGLESPGEGMTVAPSTRSMEKMAKGHFGY